MEKRMRRTSAFVLSLLVVSAMLSIISPTLAHPVTVDGNPNDWSGIPPLQVNSYTVNSGELVWRDNLGDVRTDLGDATNFDITEFRVTGDSENIYFLLRFDNITATWLPLVYITIDSTLDNRGEQWLPDYSDTLVSSAAKWENVIKVCIENTGVYDTSWNFTTGTSTSYISEANDVIEISVQRSSLAIYYWNVLRITVAVFKDNGGFPADIPGTSNALDVVTTVAGNTWEDVQDNVIDYYLVVHFNNNGDVVVGGTGTLPATANLLPPVGVIQVQQVSPAEKLWTPYTWENVIVVVTDNDMNLENVYLMAYENSLDNTAPDNIRDHYTWLASKVGGNWQFSCLLGSAYIELGTCSVIENHETKTYILIFDVRLAKTAAPGSWDLYARAVDENKNENYLENTNAILVAAYLEMTLSADQLTFTGYPGQSIPASQNPLTVSVSSNLSFDIQVRAAGNWSGPSTIPANATKATGAVTVSLSTSFQDVYTGVSYGETVNRNIDWILEAPPGASIGTYTNTFYVRIQST